MNLDDIYHLVSASPHGSSGRGVSFWTEANKCGRAVNLKAKYPAPPRVEGEDIDPLRCGTFFHALQEYRLQPSRLDMVWDMTDGAIQDKDWLEALRLFRAYNRDWAVASSKWCASVLGVEVLLPGAPETKALVRDLFSDDVTFRADWVGEIHSDQDIESVYEATGLLLPGPGRYIFDHKTASSRKEMHKWEFEFGLQGLTYLHLYNLEHPETPALGMVFDQIYRHEQISKTDLLTKTGTIKRQSSYSHFLALPDPDAEKIIQNMVRSGKYNIEKDRPNPSECFRGYEVCPFFKTGQCRRF